MKYKLRILTLISVLTLLGACGDKLEINPNDTLDSDDAVQTSGDVEALIVGAYNALGDGDLLGGNMQRDAELLGDAGPSGGAAEIFWDGTFTAPDQIYFKIMLITNDQARQTWLDAYYAINICNVVLKNLAVVDDIKRARVEGEAKFIRGILHFELVRLFAKSYNDGDPTANPGVPIVTETTNPTTPVVRNSVEEVYVQVLSDLRNASLLLPDVNGFFATKYSAFAILTRVYLMQQVYDQAALYADSVIQSGEFALTGDFAEAFNNTSTGDGDRTSNTNASPEDIFSIQLTSQDGVNNLNTFFASSDFGGRGDIYVQGAHYALYEPGDERATFFYGGDYTSKFNNLFGNLVVVRLAEMYLTRAEANFREATSIGDSPINDLNYVRSRAGLGGGVAALNNILRERRLELAFEGHSIHDLRRTESNIGSLSFDDPTLIFPIPQREIIINSSLEQNEAYQ